MTDLNEALSRLRGMSGVDHLNVARLGVHNVIQRIDSRVVQLPIEAWRNAAAGLPDACRVVENAKARATLDAGLALWLETGVTLKKTDLFGEGDNTIGLVGRIENTIRDIRNHGDEIAKLEGMDTDSQMPIVEALDKLAFAWAAIINASQEAEEALKSVRASEPLGKDALGKLGQKISGGRGEFESFAIAARQAWRDCGEALKGPESSFERFLDRWYEAVFDRSIPSRAQLLGNLRNHYGSAPTQKRWK